MNKKQYIQPNVVCYHFNNGQELMAGSTIETEVFNDEFDPKSMESLSRNHGHWDDEDDNIEE
jgi:hypothetical protein